MATLKNKRRLAAVSKEKQEHPRNNHLQNTSVPGITEEYITHVSEKIEGRVSEKLSQEFSRTESRILGALSKVDKVFFNPQMRTLSGTVAGAFLNSDVENQEATGDRSQNDFHPEVEFSVCQSRNLNDSGPEEASLSH